MKQETPARVGEGVSKLGSYSDAHTTDRARVQYLARIGLTDFRASIIAPLAFGEAA